ncbi:MAG: DUF2793 domain-containing protein [Alphaproteobacteria bacterium]|nr:DUF2793 domain-containing protein [Alphaproteobacteria bacterium]
MATTPKLSLPYLAPQQAQKHVTVNEALRLIDAVAQISVIDRDLGTPPASPANGDAYIAPAGAAGDWAGGENALFVFTDGAWMKRTPQPGWVAWLVDEEALVVWSDGAWRGLEVGFGAGLASGDFDRVGVNASADAINRLTVESPSVLFNRETDTVSLTLNKEAAGDDARIVLQTDFSSRAIIGLLGDDDFALKVSADGAAFATALKADGESGHVGLAGADADDDAALAVGGDAKANAFLSVVTALTADDSTVDVPTPAPGGLAVIYATGPAGRDNGFPNLTQAGAIFFDTGGSIFAMKAFGHANFEVSTAPLSGATGTDGSTTVSAQAGKLVIENRSGAAYRYSVTFLG